MTNIWEDVLARIETKINRHSFYTWFKPTSYLADHGASIAVQVPNALFRDWLTKHYSAVLNEALAELDRTGTEVSFVAEGVLPAPTRCRPRTRLPLPWPRPKSPSSTRHPSSGPPRRRPG